MLTLYHAPRTRSVRVVWLLEELGVPYQLERVEFEVPSDGFFAQRTPLGKIPVLVDGDATFAESGAILEYLLERHDDGTLAPRIGDPARGAFLQWMHYPEGTASQPLSVLIWHLRYKGDADAVPTVVEDAKERASRSLDFVERGLGESDYLLGDRFSAADIMMAYTLLVAQVFDLLGDRPRLEAYLARLTARPAFARALAA